MTRYLALQLIILLVAALMLAASVRWDNAAVAAMEPMATAKETPVPCEHVATADTIRIYFCEDYDLFVNQLGFMAFEP